MSTWDLSLKKQLRHGAGQFTLEVAFRSAAQRLVLCGQDADAAHDRRHHAA